MFRFLVLLAFMVGVLQTACAQAIIRYDGEANLEARLDWARTTARSNGLTAFRFGFSILRDAESNSRIGHYRSDGGKTLTELLGADRVLASDSTDYLDAARKELARLKDNSQSRIVRRPMAVLLKFSSSARELQEVFVADYESQVWFDDEPLLWAGDVSDSDALALATQLYQSVKSSSLREDVVPIVGVLDPSDKTFAVLKNILAADSSPDVREKAVFWIGRHGTDLAYATVLKAIQSDPDGDVREHAVFVLGRFDRGSVFDELVRIARSENDEPVAEQARFWLGRRIADQFPESESASSDESRIQRQVLYAPYGDDEDEDAIRALAEIAEGATSGTVRREAILMLSRSDRPEALEALVAIYRQ